MNYLEDVDTDVDTETDVLTLSLASLPDLEYDMKANKTVIRAHIPNWGKTGQSYPVSEPAIPHTRTASHSEESWNRMVIISGCFVDHYW